jgi:4-hydroxyphenylpyruvate dioxygenase
MKLESLGIRRLEGIHYYVHDLERSRRFYTGKLDFAETWRSSAELEQAGRQKSACFTAGNINVVCSEPAERSDVSARNPGRASRFLSKHPDGVGTLIYDVEDIDKTFRLLDERGGTPIDDIQTFKTDTGSIRAFSIATPFGDCTFRFRQTEGTPPLFPGAIAVKAGGNNRFGFENIDHITANFQTMKPMLLWMQHVMGFEQLWEVSFHTQDVDATKHTGSGLKSIVVWDPISGVKFANNEPQRPFFKSSQINIFNEELRGDGVQHVALTVRDILGAVRELRGNGVTFMPTPGTYYDMLPERLKKCGVGSIEEDIETLRELEVLVDGDHHAEYMLQIFLKESSGLYNDPKAGPFFYEIIQRKGGKTFGAGNFRALFESIERDQRARGLI